jgi:type II secretory ATPase GspE/PulE/Tfp pilus assembly ATPase PilB-like protein
MAKKQQYELPPIEFEPVGKTVDERQAIIDTVEPTEGFPMMTLMTVDLILRRADLAIFDYSAQAVSFRYQIDGLWVPMPGMDRESGDPMLASLKQMAGMNWQDRRNRQEGSFRALFEKKRYEFRVISQGVKTGERVAIYVGRKRDNLDNLTDMGMRDGMKAQISEILNGKEGMAVSSAMPGEGYTSCWRGLLSGGDRFLRDYYVIECEGKEEPEVINVNTVSYHAAGNHFTPLPKLMLKEPHVLAFPDLADGSDLNQMSELCEKKGLLVLTRVQARNAAESITRLLAMNPDKKRLAANLRVVLNMRLVRKLCTKCRQPFPPSPQLLVKLGFPPGRVRQLYKPTIMRGDELDERGEPVPPCPVCYGTGYVGRTGVFEMFVIGDALRKAIASGESRPEQLQSLAIESGQASMQDELALMVARGVTSLEEMQRILTGPARK